MGHGLNQRLEVPVKEVMHLFWNAIQYPARLEYPNGLLPASSKQQSPNPTCHRLQCQVLPGTNDHLLHIAQRMLPKVLQLPASYYVLRQ